MYLVSIYFDEKTDGRIRKYVSQVAERTSNSYMIEGEVPPHITISAFETKREEEVIERLASRMSTWKKGKLQWASVGVFLPYVIYLSPVLNGFLDEVSRAVYSCVSIVEDTKVSPYYRPLQWMPHTTIAKKLSKDQMQIAFGVLQERFQMFSGEVVRIGVAKTNPYREIASWELK